MIKFLRPRNKEEVSAVLVNALARIENYTRSLDSIFSVNELVHSNMSAEMALLKESQEALRAALEELKMKCEDFEARISDME